MLAMEKPDDPANTKCLQELLDALWILIFQQPERHEDMDFLMPVEDIFSSQEEVQLLQEESKEEQSIQVMKLKSSVFTNTRKSTVTGVEMFNKTLDKGIAGTMLVYC